MKHSKEYYRKRQRQLENRLEKVSVHIEILEATIERLQEELCSYKLVREKLEDKMIHLDYQESIDDFLDSIIPKGW